MPKARVYELAKELGVDSKTVLNKLEAMGEFVKSASSTVEPPVARKLRNAFASNAQGKSRFELFFDKVFVTGALVKRDGR